MLNCIAGPFRRVQWPELPPTQQQTGRTLRQLSQRFIVASFGWNTVAKQQSTRIIEWADLQFVLLIFDAVIETDVYNIKLLN